MNIDDAADDGTRVMSMKPWVFLFAMTVFAQLPAAAFRFVLGYAVAVLVEFVFHLPLIPWLCVFVLVVRHRVLMEDECGRWLLGYVVTVVADLILGLHFGPFFYAFGLAIAPLVWSVSAFRFPGSGWRWHGLVGAREPSEEEKGTLREGVEALGPRVTSMVRFFEFYVIEHPEPFAVSRGRAMVVSTGLLKMDDLEGPLAHEFGHLDSMDTRLSQALDQLTPWDRALPPSEEDYQQAGSVKRFVMDARTWFLRIAGGRVILESGYLQAFWAEHFRRREVAADLLAVRLGYGEALADFLDTYKEPQELPNPRGLFNYRHHPPTAHRISALRKAAEEAEEAEEEDE